MALKLNPNARKLHSDVSHQINDSLDLFDKNEVNLERIYATLGRYDYLAIFEAPDQSIAFRIASEINSRGILETETWPVITFDEFTQLFSG
jgi:uncharacterized protein with GYD domain